METLEIILRASAATGLLIFTALAIRDGWRYSAIRFSIIGAISVTAHLIQHNSMPLWVFAPLRFIDACSIAFVWWAGLAMLEENFRLKPLHWLGMAAYGMSVVPYRFEYLGWLPQTAIPDWYHPFVDLVTLALVGHLFWKAVSGYREDLVSERRQIRILIVFAIALAMLIAIFGENALQANGIGYYTLMLIAAVTLPIAIALIFWVTRFHPEIMLFQPIRASAPIASSVDPRDAAAHGRLVDIMETDKAYTEHGLTIGSLASKVGIPEHQLRALINRAMGYRNFAAFLNRYRVDAAKTVLADPEQARLPVLTIAMDAGFGSLAPFNRAFRELEGQTPTAFRAEALSNGATDQS